MKEKPIVLSVRSAVSSLWYAHYAVQCSRHTIAEFIMNVSVYSICFHVASSRRSSTIPSRTPVVDSGRPYVKRTTENETVNIM